MVRHEFTAWITSVLSSGPTFVTWYIIVSLQSPSHSWRHDGEAHRNPNGNVNLTKSTIPLAPLRLLRLLHGTPHRRYPKPCRQAIQAFPHSPWRILPLYEQEVSFNSIEHILSYNMDFTSHKLLISFSCCDSGHKGHKGPGYHFTHPGLFLWAYPMSNVAHLVLHNWKMSQSCTVRFILTIQ